MKKYCKSLFDFVGYDMATGNFHAKKDSSRRKKGDVVGYINSDGYLLIGINGSQYLSHRLAWLYVYGELPKNQIDHINRIKTDNRICNLREATVKQNSENKGLRADNTTGFVGVYRNSNSHKFEARITHFGKDIHLGLFETKELAAEARNKKAKEIFSHFS